MRQPDLASSVLTSTSEQRTRRGATPPSSNSYIPHQKKPISNSYSPYARQYKWGINQRSSLPQGFTFLKHKKQWMKGSGRTIISYRNSKLAKLLQAVAIALDTMVKQTWPTGPGNASTPQLWKTLQTYLADIPDDTNLAMINDDLIGFFNSVPHKKLQQSLRILLYQWQHIHNQDIITVDTTRSLGSLHSMHTGSFRPNKRIPTHRVIHLKHVPDIIHLSFQFSEFQALGKTWQQIQGTGIGNQISPILANIPITLHEINWQQAFHTELQHSQNTQGPHLFIRYVDNRLVLAPQATFHTLPFTTLALNDFYQLPIQLEQVGDSHFLGFELNLPARSITYIQPAAKWQIRDACPAGSQRLTLSGLLSRAATIQRYTWPPHHIPASIEHLLQCYVQKGHDEQKCRRTIRKLLSGSSQQ